MVNVTVNNSISSLLNASSISATVVQGSLGQQAVIARDQALEYANQAANSAAAAANSEIQAANSAAYAANSEIQAANSAAQSANSASQSANSAAQSANSASQSANSASQSANSAAQSANSATQAANSAVQAANSAVYAANSQINAANSAAQAANSATQAANSAVYAANSAINAANSEIKAANSATQAANSAIQSANSATNSANSAAQAANSATQAANSQVYAANSAVNAANSASQAANSAIQAANSAAYAANSAAAAANSAAYAANSQVYAANAAINAANSEIKAANSAAYAANSATAASNSEIQAANSAVQAANSAIQAANSAFYANISKVSAELARDASVAASTISTTQAQTAQAQASLAQGYAASAASVVQQDLSGITAQALHRSPNAITALHIYDTSKDSDGGAWTEKCQHTSWWNEALSGKWLGAQANEFLARVVGATLSPELVDTANTVAGWSAFGTNTVSQEDGAIKITYVSDSRGALCPLWAAGALNADTVSGKLYAVTFTARATGTVRVGVWNTNTGLIGSYVDVNTTAYATQTFHFVASGSTNHRIQTTDMTTGEVLWIKDISVREVISFNTASNDYFQLTTDGKFYRLWKNIMAQTENLSHSAWAKIGGVTVEYGFPAPDGTNTAWKVFFPSNGGSSQLYQVLSAAFPVTQSVWLKADSSLTLDYGIYDGGSDASTITVTSTWQQFTRTRNAGLTTADRRGMWMYPQATNVTVYLWRPQIEPGATATAYEAKAAVYGISEVFRGNKADFPRLAALVGEAASLTIYDLTEPGRPMWMRFLASAANNTTTTRALLGANTQSCAAAMNGIIATGSTTNSGYQGSLITFPSDSVPYLTNGVGGSFRGDIARRNESLGFSVVGGYPTIVGTSISFIAMTVLPNAPIDPTTGLRVPTIGIQTNDGISVIRHDGTTVRSTSSGSHTGMAIMGTRLFFVRSGAGDPLYQADLMTIGANFGTGVMDYLSHSIFPRFLTASGRELIVRTDRSPWQISRILTSVPASTTSVRGEANIRSTHNTGWMPANIRRVYLSDTDTGTVSGAELVTNGTFDVDATGWSGLGPATVSGGTINVSTSSGQYWIIQQTIPTVVG